MKKLQYALLLVCLLFLGLMIKDLNGEELKNLILNSDYKFIIIAMGFLALNVYLKVYRLKIIAEQFGLKVSLWLAYKTQVASLLFALLTPGRVGEITKVYLLSEKQKEKFPLITGIMFFEIIMDFICITFISLIFAFVSLKNTIITIAIIVLMISGLVGLYLTSKSGNLLNKLPNKVKILLGPIDDIKVNLTYKWYLNISLTIGAWFLDGVFQFFLLKSINFNSEVLTLVALSAISSVISVISILPLGLGVTDLSSLFLYKNFAGLGNEQILFLVNSTRIFIILTLMLMTLPFLKFLFSINLKAIKKEVDH